MYLLCFYLFASEYLATFKKTVAMHEVFVHTRTTLPGFAKKDNNVVRQHEEFVWLHDRIEENDDYAGYIVSYRVKSLTRC